MQQTLLALVAMLIVTFLGFNQKQAHIRNQQHVVRAELTEMALSVAQQSMEVVQARAFDDATVGLPPDSTITDSTKFSSSPFTSGNHCHAFEGSDMCDDVDDFDEMVTGVVPFPLPGGHEFDFDVDVRVRYVDENLQPTGGAKSFRKEVTIFVQDRVASGGSRLYQPIEYSEVISYP